jgi:exodeoxyribonuclease VII large subunit
MDVIYLSVPFKDKDIVKALGARWDGAARQWFVAQGAQARFARWMPKEGAVPDRPDARHETSENVGAPRSSPGARIGAPLSSVLFDVSESVRKAWPAPRWIVAEVASCRVHPNSGHIYLELVEHDDSGREVAKANARIWSSNARIARKFEKETGGRLGEGMKILALAQGDFSIQYGFGLTVEDLDPAWSLGEMQRKVSQIREKLIEEGIFELNAKLRAAPDFVSVAVIAPDGAAGLGDFMADADLLIKAGLCSFHFIAATFEGPKAQGSLVAALARASEMAARGEVDAVAIVRGGGAKTSLNWLNEYELARQICLLPCPAMVGVGHERDETILDEVACESFDTPSKVVGAIASRVLGNAQAAKLALEQLRRDAGQACSLARGAAEALLGEARERASAAVARERSKLDLALSKAADACSSHTRAAKADIESLAREVVGLGPRASLDRGYCVATQGGQAKARAADLNTQEDIVLRMSDGDVALRRVK